MRYISFFEEYSNNNNILIIVDVQKSFSKFFTDNYIKELQKYASTFRNVYQIWDNHIDGKDADKDFLYDAAPEVPDDHSDLYDFDNQRDLIEKRYNYDVDPEFYKKILDEKVYKNMKSRENTLKKGEWFPTTEGTIIVYVNNNHQFFHLPKKLYDLFKALVNKEVIICGGADGECLEDIITAGVAMGVIVKRNDNYIYSAKYCPIK